MLKGRYKKKYIEKCLQLIKNNMQFGGASQNNQLSMSIFLNETIFAYIWANNSLHTNTTNFYLLIPHLLNNNMIITTTKTKLSSTSCRMWQLLYIILYEWFSRDPIDMVILMTKTYQIPVDISQYEMINNVKTSIEIIKNNEIKDKSIDILNRILFKNDNLNTNGDDAIFQNIFNIDDFNHPVDKNGIYNYCLCLNFQQIPDGSTSIGKIVHFFTIVHKKNNEEDQWYLNSSYGSDYVKVPQYSTLLDIEEFQIFLDYINRESDIDESTFSKLFIKYFLANQKEWYKDKIDTEDICTPWYNCAKMLTDFSTDNNELKYIVDNDYLTYLCVSWIKPYSNIIKEIVNILK